MTLTFPNQLDRVRNNVLAQQDKLERVATIFADAIASGGLVHVYANGHSRLSIEEQVIRMGALTGFHPLMMTAHTTFTNVVGNDGIRTCQSVEKFEGLTPKMLEEFDIAPGEPLVVITATGTTAAAVDMALAWQAKYPDNPLIGIASDTQSRAAATKHSSGKNLHHVVEDAKLGIFLDNGMPMGDVTTEVGPYKVCPLSSIGSLTLIQSLNELTIRVLHERGIEHHVLGNMHLKDTQSNYDAWVLDQRKRYARATYNPELH
ncbi:MAG: SIS domain-containing protein [Verrucomicrobiota bacterium]